MASSEFYLNEYGGTEYPDLDKLLKRAESIIDCYVITPVETWQQVYFDKAVCAQAEYIGSMGGTEAYASLSGVSSVSIGSFSMSGGAVTSGSSEAVKPCPAATGYLERGGLAGRYITL